MNTTNRPQAWESEMEAGELEQRGVSFISCVFTVIVGALLLLVVLIKSQFKSIADSRLSGTKEQEVWKRNGLSEINVWNHRN